MCNSPNAADALTGSAQGGSQSCPDSDKAKQDPELLTYTDECVGFGEGAVHEYSKQQFSKRRGYPRSPERGSQQEPRLACLESTMDESRAAITRVPLSEGTSEQAWFGNDASGQA